MTRPDRLDFRNAALRRWLSRQPEAVTTLQAAAFAGLSVHRARELLRRIGAVEAGMRDRSLWWVAPARWP